VNEVDLDGDVVHLTSLDVPEEVVFSLSFAFIASCLLLLFGSVGEVFFCTLELIVVLSC